MKIRPIESELCCADRVIDGEREGGRERDRGRGREGRERGREREKTDRHEKANSRS